MKKYKKILLLMFVCLVFQNCMKNSSEQTNSLAEEYVNEKLKKLIEVEDINFAYASFSEGFLSEKLMDAYIEDGLILQSDTESMQSYYIKLTNLMSKWSSDNQFNDIEELKNRYLATVEMKDLFIALLGNKDNRFHLSDNFLAVIQQQSTFKLAAIHEIVAIEYAVLERKIEADEQYYAYKTEFIDHAIELYNNNITLYKAFTEKDIYKELPKLEIELYRKALKKLTDHVVWLETLKQKNGDEIIEMMKESKF